MVLTWPPHAASHTCLAASMAGPTYCMRPEVLLNLHDTCCCPIMTMPIRTRRPRNTSTYAWSVGICCCCCWLLPWMSLPLLVLLWSSPCCPCKAPDPGSCGEARGLANMLPPCTLAVPPARADKRSDCLTSVQLWVSTCHREQDLCTEAPAGVSGWWWRWGRGSEVKPPMLTRGPLCTCACAAAPCAPGLSATMASGDSSLGVWR